MNTSTRMWCNYHSVVLNGYGEYRKHCRDEHDGAAIAVSYLHPLHDQEHTVSTGLDLEEHARMLQQQLDEALAEVEMWRSRTVTGGEHLMEAETVDPYFEIVIKLPLNQYDRFERVADAAGADADVVGREVFPDGM